mmetsp:Transcript_53738/g.89131  ORF Transcript_53738/g.89131 Transcript_53738/m.89131 type:complete len:197 (-) Transcript_53738:9-599(-)
MSYKYAIQPKQKTYQNNQYGKNGYISSANSHHTNVSRSSNGSNGSNDSNTSKSTQYNIVPKKRNNDPQFQKYAAKPLPSNKRPRNQKMSSSRVTYGHKLSESMQRNSNESIVPRGHRHNLSSNTPQKPKKRPVQSLFDGEHQKLLTLPFDVPDSADKSELQQMHTQMRSLLDADVTALESFYDDQLKLLDDLLTTM